MKWCGGKDTIAFKNRAASGLVFMHAQRLSYALWLLLLWPAFRHKNNRP
jgi:hypothetical protein